MDPPPSATASPSQASSAPPDKPKRINVLSRQLGIFGQGEAACFQKVLKLLRERNLTILQTCDHDLLLEIRTVAQRTLMMQCALDNDSSAEVLIGWDQSKKVLLQTDANGYTALHLAAQKGSSDFIRLFPREFFIDQQPPSSPNLTRDTPLHVSIRADQKKCLEVLLEKGADWEKECLFSTENREWLNSLDLAIALDRWECLDLIMSKKKITQLTVRSLLTGIRYRSHQTLQNLFKKYSNLVFPVFTSLTKVNAKPMDIAIKEKNLSAIYLLWQYGDSLPENINVTDASVNATLNYLRGCQVENCLPRSFQSSNPVSLTDMPEEIRKIFFPKLYLPQPLRSSEFIGREEILEALQSKLLSCYLPDKSSVLTIVGEMGIGKSTLALQYAYRYASRYYCCIWIRCQSTSSYQADYRRLARILNLSAVGNFSTLQARIHAKLAQNETDKPWLLIFDNWTEVVLPQLPKQGVVALVTCQKNYIARESIQIPSLLPTPQVLKTFFPKASPNENESVTKIFSISNGNPFCLRLVALCQSLSNTSIANLLQQVTTQNKPSLQEKVAQIFQILLERLNSEFARFLKTVVFLSISHVDENVISTWLRLYGSKDIQQEKLIGHLKAFSLIQFDSENQFSIPPLLKELILKMMNESEKKQFFLSAVRLINELLKTSHSREEEINETVQPLSLHVQHLFHSPLWLNIIQESDDGIALWEMIHPMLERNIESEQSLELCKRLENRIKPSLKQTDTKQKDLKYEDKQLNINLLFFLGKLNFRKTEGLAYFEEALKLIRNDPMLVSDIQLAMGCTLYYFQRFEEALKSFQDSLKLRKQFGLKGDPKLGETNLQIGLCHEALNRYDEAVSLYKERVESYSQIESKQTSKKINDTTNEIHLFFLHYRIANCLMKQGKYQLAIVEFENLLDFLNCKYAFASRWKIGLLENISYCYFCLKNIDQAASIFTEAREMLLELERVRGTQLSFSRATSEVAVVLKIRDHKELLFTISIDIHSLNCRTEFHKAPEKEFRVFFKFLTQESVKRLSMYLNPQKDFCLEIDYERKCIFLVEQVYQIKRSSYQITSELEITSQHDEHLQSRVHLRLDQLAKSEARLRKDSETKEQVVSTLVDLSRLTSHSREELYKILTCPCSLVSEFVNINSNTRPMLKLYPLQPSSLTFSSMQGFLNSYLLMENNNEFNKSIAELEAQIPSHASALSSSQAFMQVFCKWVFPSGFYKLFETVLQAKEFKSFCLLTQSLKLFLVKVKVAGKATSFPPFQQYLQFLKHSIASTSLSPPQLDSLLNILEICFLFQNNNDSKNIGLNFFNDNSEVENYFLKIEIKYALELIALIEQKKILAHSIWTLIINPSLQWEEKNVVDIFLFHIDQTLRVSCALTLYVMRQIIENEPNFLLFVPFILAKAPFNEEQGEFILGGIVYLAMQMLTHVDSNYRSYAFAFLKGLIKYSTNQEKEIKLPRLKNVAFVEIKNALQAAIMAQDYVHEFPQIVLNIINKNVPIQCKVAQALVNRMQVDQAAFQDSIPVQVVKDAQSISIEQAFNDFLKGTQEKVLLLTGEAQSGKSFITKKFAWDALKKYNPYEAEEYLVIFVNLATLKDPIQEAISEFLESLGFDRNAINQLKQKKILWIFDGYHHLPFKESSGQKELRNLYKSNECEKWKNSKFVFTCVTDFCSDEYFKPNEGKLVHYKLSPTQKLLDLKGLDPEIVKSLSSISPVFIKTLARYLPNILQHLDVLQHQEIITDDAVFIIPYAFPNLFKLIKIFEIDVTNLSLIAIMEKCFNSVVEVCKLQQWSKIRQIQNDLRGLNVGLFKTIITPVPTHITPFIGPFHHLLDQHDPVLIKEILDHQLQGPLSSDLLKFPLHAAIKLKEDWIKLLIPLIPLNQKDGEGKTPLHIAVESRQPEVVKQLMTAGASVQECYAFTSQKTTMEFSPLAWAVAIGEIECFEKLLPSCSLIEFSKGIGNLLHVAVKFRQTRMLEMLLARCPRELLEQHDPEGNTPIHAAAAQDNPRAIILFLKQKGVNFAIAHKEGLLLPNDRKIIGYVTDFNTQLIRDFSNILPRQVIFRGNCIDMFHGAWRKIAEQNRNERVADVYGLKLGAWMATLVCLGYELDDQTLRLSSLIQNSTVSAESKHKSSRNNEIMKKIWQLLALLPPAHVFAHYIKLYESLWKLTGESGESLREKIEEFINSKTGIKYCTFEDLHQLIAKGKSFKNLHLYGVKLGQINETTHFCFSTTPDLIISDALVIALSRPGIHTPHYLYYKINGERFRRNDDGIFVNQPFEFTFSDNDPFDDRTVEITDSDNVVFPFRRHFILKGNTASDGERQMDNFLRDTCYTITIKKQTEGQISLMNHELLTSPDGEGVLNLLLGLRKINDKEYMLAKEYLDKAYQILTTLENRYIAQLAEAYKNIAPLLTDPQASKQATERSQQLLQKIDTSVNLLNSILNSSDLTTEAKKLEQHTG